MTTTHSLIRVLLVFSVVACMAQSKRPLREQGMRRHSGISRPPAARQEKPSPAKPTVPESPPTPATLAQSPPTPPQVTYRNGMLMVVANNSTLADILSAVQSRTGASIDFPAGQAQERVVASVGPGPATQVLASLLNGSHFDYILLGTPGRADLLQKAILTPRQGGALASSSPPPGPPQAAPIQRPAPAEEEEGDDTAEQPEGVAPPPPQPQPAQPPVQQPGQVPVQPGQQGPKSPEQLLQELQRLQQRNQPAPSTEPDQQPPPPNPEQ